MSNILTPKDKNFPIGALQTHLTLEEMVYG